MNKRIIALKGKGNSGKTTTIKLLPDILKENGFSQVPNKHKKFGSDFRDVFIKDGLIVGVTSSGDTYDLVTKRLSELIDDDCVICICACRTFDRSEKGTIAATKEFKEYETEYVKKTYEDDVNRQYEVNKKDAKKLMDRILKKPNAQHSI